MKTIKLLLLLLAIPGLLFLVSCSDDDETPLSEFTGEETTFNLMEVNGSGVNGTVTFKEKVDNSTVVVLNLSGTADGGDHPTHIHLNSAAEGGSITVDLENVNGQSGISETTIDQLNDGTAITYMELIDLDGHVNVHLSAEELSTLIARGDIGVNALTGNSETYTLNSVSDPSISGQVTFAERVSGETLVTIQLEGTEPGGDHPAHIHLNTAAEGGSVAIPLNNIEGASGLSRTSVSQNGEASITYEELLDFDGYVNVHKSSSEMGVSIAQGDIGQNDLTGNAETYMLNSVSDPAISGEVTFAERANGETLVTIQLEGTPNDGDHPAHIHNNSAEEGGSVAIPLTNVNGITGISKTNVSQMGDAAITYDDLINFDGHVNVHKSGAEISTYIAQGDIGSN